MKKPYEKPTLKQHGSVESITLGGTKAIGDSDGWYLVTGEGLATVS